MSDFPYKRFVLTPSFAVKEINVAPPLSVLSQWVTASCGRSYRIDETFETMQGAAAYANARILKESERLQKLQASLEKRKANVAKWEPKA